MNGPRRTFPGTRRPLPRGAKLLSAVPAQERVEFSLLLRRRAPLPPPAPGSLLSRAQFAEQHGADPADLAAVQEFAREHGLEVLRADAAQRLVRLAGPASAVNAACGIELKNYRRAGGRVRCHTAPVSLPEAVAPLVVGVLGLDNRAQARPHFRRAAIKPGKPAGAEPSAAKPAAARPLTPVEVAKLYQFPSELDGTGQCIGILELGGGYRDADLQTYFSGLGLPVPSVTAVSVLAGKNDPDGPTRDANAEVMLDIEVAGAVAPRAKIAVYFAPNTDDGFLQALSTAIHDDTNQPSVVSISWGAAESEWSVQAMSAFDSVCEDAAALGVTILGAAGDNGASDLPQPDGQLHVDFPASSPHVIGCGGTRLETSGGTIDREVVWNSDGATGGGVSAVFPLPDYQQNANVPPSANPGGAVGRGVPDLAGNADPNTGYVTRVDGKDTVIGGTSAVSPLLAGLLALVNQGRGQPVGFLYPQLYSLAPRASVFRDITTGDNNGYTAGPGWDASTGWGSPQGAELLQALAAG